MKIVQVNAWLGRLLHPLLQLLEQESADVVCLQEVLSSTKLNPLFDSFSTLEFLKEQYPHVFFAPTYSFNALGTKVSFGNAILSKYPIENQQTVFVNGDFHTDQNVDGYTRNIRNLQSCSITIEGTEVHVVNHHAFHDLDPMGNQKSVECINKAIAHIQTLGSPLIVCGDFNTKPESPTIKALVSELKLDNHVVTNNVSTTLSSVFRVPNIKVVSDYIFTKGDIKIDAFIVSDSVVSDHKALILEASV